MKAITVIMRIFFLCLLLANAGCETPSSTDASFSSRSKKLSAYILYAPVKIKVIPLTEFTSAADDSEASQLKAYVGLFDSFDSQIKTPAVFRFELYTRVLRSAEPKGKRITIWPDIDLTESGKNNKYWRDFLRAYEFDLDFEPQPNQNYILQVTALCPSGKRLSTEFILNGR